MQTQRGKSTLRINLLLLVTILLLDGCDKASEYSLEQLQKLKASVIQTNANWQLFLDDYWIHSQEGIKSTLHQPEKYKGNPLITADVPWEENPYCFGTVIYDQEDSIFKFWYQSYNQTLNTSDKTPILYATSIDGLEWERPNLGIIEFQGSTKNNIVIQNYGYHDLYSPSVIKDMDDPDPNKRYKMIWWDFPLGKEGYQDDGMCVAFSPDGIRWDKYSGNPVLHATKSEQSISDVMFVMKDQNTGKFVAYTKGWADPWPAFRQIVRTESSDFIHWSKPEVVITHAHNLEDPQSYGMTVSQYGKNYIGQLYSYKNPGDETIDVQLVISHDNKKWSRVAKQATFIPLGQDDSWDDGMIFSPPMFNHNGKTIIYYSGWDNAHNSKERRRSGIGLATLRLNGFVSLDAGVEGEVTTRLIKNTEGPLLVNANAKGGSLQVELLDARGIPVPGYAMKDCEPVQSDDTMHWVRWKDQQIIPNSLDALQIRFKLKNASLYGFYAGAEAVRMQ